MRPRGMWRIRLSAVARQSAAFTLVELLVVIAIIGTLLVILLPAVQAAREAARRVQCVSHIKNLALAVHNYHDTHGELPPAARMPDSVVPTSSEHEVVEVANGQQLGPNWAVLILPYLEQQALYNTFVFQDSTGATVPLGDLANEPARSATLSIMLCPSDSGSDQLCNIESIEPTAQGDWGRGNYAINAFQMYPPFYWSAIDGGTWGWQNILRRGVTGINEGLRLGQLTDGTSNTLMLSEIRIGLADIDSRGTWAMGLCGSSYLCRQASNYLSSPNSCAFAADDILGGPILDANIGRFTLSLECMTVDFIYWPSVQSVVRSSHPGGVNAALADASVRFISDAIDTGEVGDEFDYNSLSTFPDQFKTWQRLNLSNDGLLLNQDFLP